MLMLKGAVVTMDVMGCQKSIPQNIIDAEGDYAIAVKGNQKKFHEQLKTYFNNTFDIDWLEGKEKWAGLKSVIVVESKLILNGRTSIEKRYYISSLEANAEKLNSIARAHWGIKIHCIGF